MGGHRKKRRARGYRLVLAGVAALAVVAFVVSLVLAPDHLQSPDQLTADASTRLSSPLPPTSSSPPSPSPAPPSVTLAFAGDVHFTGRTEDLLDDPATAFGPISAALSAADIGMVNLETAITERGVEEPKQFHFRAPAAALDALAASGVDVASLANNHAVDYGPVGLEDTLAAVTAGPISVVGIGPDAATAYAPYRTVVRGVGISIFGASQVPDRTYQRWTAIEDSPGIATTGDQDRLIAGVRQASAAGDVVVVYLHWGIEGDQCPTQEMQDLATELATAGADAIVGAHAHLLLGAGYLDQPGTGAYVAYGLGNFLWWRPQAFSDDTGVLTLTVQNGAVTGSRFTPALIDDTGRPQPVMGPQALAEVTAFEELRGCAGLVLTPSV
ncbi:MAG: CapA family protein [Geodermatophilaceae bacterium]|nr:CapA family protein [Geodermatophilaceae bacterium]